VWLRTEVGPGMELGNSCTISEKVLKVKNEARMKEKKKQPDTVPLFRLKAKEGHMVIYPRIERQPDGSLKILHEDIVRSIAGLPKKKS